MSYLLDTNVISELAQSKPNKKVLDWFETVPNESLYLSVLSWGEIRKGVERLPENKRKEKLRLWLEVDLSAWFSTRLLVIDHNVADRSGRLMAEVKRPVPAIDSLLAATALSYDLRLVTRNKRDFQFPGLQIFSPWD